MDLSYEYEDYSEEEEQDDEAILRENLFTEAEDNLPTDPLLALEQFRNLVLLEEQDQTHRFECVLHILVICIQQRLWPDIPPSMGDMVAVLHTRSMNEAQDALRDVLEALTSLSGEDGPHREELLAALEQALAQPDRLEQLWLAFSVKVCQLYLKEGRAEAVEGLLQKVEDRMGPAQKEKYVSIGQELYSLQIQQCLLTKQTHRLKALFQQYRQNQSASGIIDNRSLAIIKETQGKLLMLEHNFPQAEVQLNEAFRLYQEIGSGQAEQVLVQLVLSSMLSHSSINPFDNREAHVYQSLPQILPLQRLRMAFERQDCEEFFSLTRDQSLFQEEFSRQLVPLLERTFCLSCLPSLVAPYRRVRLQHLAGRLHCEENTLKGYLVQCLLQGSLHGSIDDLEATFHRASPQQNLHQQALESIWKHLAPG